MAHGTGLRDVCVITKVTSYTLSIPCSQMEVTNNGSTEILIYVNDFPEQGHPTKGIASKGIPVKAGETRKIPMQVYNFTATGPVTVVAYTM